MQVSATILLPELLQSRGIRDLSPWLWILASLLISGNALAHTDPASAPLDVIEPTEDEPTRASSDEAIHETIDVKIEGRGRPSPRKPRPVSRVDRRDMEERLPRSAPDALRFEPGVFVQQTAQSQASAYLRGRTGQQTILLFDGIRLNTSTFRQGPNQYFFTIDSHTVHHIDVERGGASTRWGSDAIGGVIHAVPMEPRLDLMRDAPIVRPRTMLVYSSADQAFGERFQLDTQIDKTFRVLGGVGYRRVGELQAGRVGSQDSQRALVPVFREDGRTQLGTGFNEATADGRVVAQLGESTRLVGAAYIYRQYDAPRTDQCPPPFAPRSECLTYDEQFRTLTYLSLDTTAGSWARKLRTTLSYQRQHERRRNLRPASFVENGGRDDLDSFGTTFFGETEPLGSHPVLTTLQYGGDLYHDRVGSSAWTEFSDFPAVIPSSRGMYLDGSHYTHGGVFVAPTLGIGGDWEARTGGRLGWARAYAPADQESGTSGVDRGWITNVGNAGLSYRPIAPVTLSANLDRSFRTPNLDDLTSRQQTGPGFQFENPNLRPEVSTTVEVGIQALVPGMEAEAWVYHSAVRNGIVRVARDTGFCPPATPQCEASWTRFQLVNAQGPSTVRGLELALRAFLSSRVLASATFMATHGEMANPQDRPTEPGASYEERVPLSRIPPVNGTAELRWGDRRGPYAGAGLRWAMHQSRLAPSDLSDARIPEGGTPGFAVMDLRAGYRVGRELLVSCVVENVGNQAYRYHGSSVYGPGRGLILHFEAGL